MIAIDLYKKLQSSAGVFLIKAQMQIAPGETVALYGESGAGKTSILRMISGLMKPDDGTLTVFGETWYSKSDNIFSKPQNRNAGFVFQDYALFPNMTVEQNISYGLNKNDDPAIVRELITLMELEKLEQSKPYSLSGGQRQRVALARAVARKPSLLLLDEPFTALDSMLRVRMQDLLGEIQKRFRLTTILVSHDLLEVARLADTVFVLEKGKITKVGKPADVVPFQHIENIIKTVEQKFNYRRPSC